jgi:hypothetical protein
VPEDPKEQTGTKNPLGFDFFMTIVLKIGH